MSSPEREGRLADILGEAIDLPDQEQRAYVERHAEDAQMAREILALLGVTEDDFLEKPAFALVAGDEGSVGRADLPGAAGPRSGEDETLSDLPPAVPGHTIEKRPVSSRVGPYRLEECLGGGGMGVVFRGFDERLQRPVALKQIRRSAQSQDSQRRFRREARAIAGIDHEAIVRVHDWLEEEDGDWLVMELIEGQHLGEVLEQHGPQAPGQVVAWAAEIASALAAAHETGILHRDLKVENVMITVGGQLKLLDFGLAKPLDPKSAFNGSLGEPLTMDGHILGTVTAMSPEQALGEELDERSDLFALGILMYRLLAGRSPFRGNFPMATMQAIVFDPPPPLGEAQPGIPTQVLRLVDRLLAKDREERPRSARQVHAQLSEIAQGLLTSAPAEIDTSQQSLRRPVTVLAAGLSPAVADTDPEALLDIVPRLDELVLDVIERWGGRLEGRMGDSWIACFGVPKASEDDARRAVHAGLDLAKGGERVAPGHVAGTLLRVGIHSGSAILTTVGDRQELALGPTFDAAIAAQESASAGVLISEAARSRTGRYFRTRALAVSDASAMKTGPASAYRVEGQGDFTELQSGRMQPLFGRARELQSLMEAFSAALEGLGRVVLLSGEPGIGKSSLLNLLRLRLRDRDDERSPTWIELHGSTLRRSAPFQPLVLQIRKMLNLRDTDSGEHQLEALRDWARSVDLPPEEIVPHLAVLLGVEAEKHSSGVDLDPRLQKRRIQEALATLWTEMADQRPLVMVVEDLQWLDPSTLEVLTLLLEQVPTVPMLVILTHRLDYTPPWSARGHIAEMRLERLQGQAVSEQMGAISGAPLPPELVAHIAAKADGVPLYVEELTRAVLESGQLKEENGRLQLTGPLDRLVIPATLQESLAARLDRLGSARAVAQLASVIGREFSRELLLRIGDGHDQVLDEGLERLLEADLVYRKGFGSRTRYLFRHSLIQDAAYASLLRRRRQVLHRRVADALAKTTRSAPSPDLLAHHLAEAGDWAEAMPHWQAAASAAILSSAHREAEAHARRALQHIDELPDKAARERAELGFLTLLGRAVAGLKGYSSEEVLAAYDRAAELCEHIADDLMVTQVNWGLWAFYSVRSAIPRAVAHGTRLLELAGRSGTTSDWLVAHSSMAVALYFGGDLEAARRHADEALRHEAANPERERTTASPQDLGVNALMSLALIDWHRGDTGSAEAWSRRALELAEQFKHPYSQVFAGSWSARLHQSLRHATRTRELAEEVIRLSERHGFFWVTQGWFFKGCALAQEAKDREPSSPDAEELTEALSWIRKGVAAYQTTGARLSLSYMQAQIAEVELWRGEVDTARHALEQAFTAAAPEQEQYWLPELHRLRGEILIAEGGDLNAAEQNFEEARGQADRAGDLALRLRAVLSLCQLYRNTQRADRARPLLMAEIDVWAQGTESGDLQQARQLLAEISPAG